MIVSLVVPGEPAVKERPRCGKRVSSTDRQKAAEAEIGRLLQARYIVPELHLGPVRLTVAFQTKSATKDVDNMLKLVMDALNGVLYGDDRQVVAIKADVQRGARQPQTRIEAELVRGEVIARDAP